MNIWVYIVIVAVLVAVLLFRKPREKVVGICEAAIESNTKKQERKERILELLASRSEASNSDIREELGVSRRSVVRYMDELEREGEVEQVGDTGRGVTYRLK